MDDRERIADIARTKMWARGDDGPEYGEDRVGGSYDVADAVLAAFGDRLLTEIPTAFWQIHMFLRMGDGLWTAEITSGSGEDRRSVASTAPTIPAAIRAALESKP